MPINVAQLNILVTTDATQAQAALSQLNATLQGNTQAQVLQAQGAMQASSAQIAAINQNLAAYQQQGSVASAAASQIVTANNNIGNSARNATASIGGFGSIGSRSLMLFNQSMNAAGQDLGPFNQSLGVMGSILIGLPGKLSGAQIAMVGFGAVMSGLALAAANLGAKQVTQEANLRTSLTDSGKDWADYADVIQTAIDKGAGYGQTQADVEHALATAAPVVQNSQQLLDLWQVAADGAAKRGQSLSAVMDMLVRGVEGNARGLKIFGVELDLVANSERNLTNITAQLAAAQAQLEDAQQHVARISGGGGGGANSMIDQALAADRMKQALDGVNRSQEDYADLQARIAATDNEPQIDKIAAATAHLAEAQARLNDLQAKQVQASVGGSPAELEKLAAASEKVLDAQERMAQAQGGDIITAQTALRDAVNQQRDALDRQFQQQQQIISGSAADISAKEAVRKAAEDLARAQYEQNLEAQHQSVQQLQQDEELRKAQQRIADAVENVTRVQLENQKAASSGSGAGAASAIDTVGDLQKKVDELKAKQGAAALDALHNLNEVLNKIGGVTKGAADAMEDTWAGHLKRIIADTENFFADLAQGWGGAALGMLPVITNLILIRKLSQAGAVAGDAGASGGLFTSLAAGFTSTVALAAGVGIAIAAIIFMLYEFEGSWDAIRRDFGRGLMEIGGWFHSTFSAARDWAVDRLEEVGGYIRDLPNHIGSGIDELRGWGSNLIGGAWHGAQDQWTQHMWPWVTGIPGMIGDAFQNEIGNMHTVGWNVITGLWQGVIDQWNNFTGWIGDAASHLPGIVKDIFGIKSPSTVFYDIGKNVMLGFQGGMDDHMHLAENSMREAARRVQSAAAVRIAVQGSGAVAGDLALGARTGGSVHIHHYSVIVNNAGHVLTSHDLADQLRDVMIEAGRNQGGAYFGGYAEVR